jgi:threonine/homoserine/homoserine lactone efflux protein
MLLIASVRWGAVGALALTALALMGSPGPVTVSLVAAGSAHGARRSAGYLVGIVLGTELVLLAVATGITAALLAVPGLRPALIALAALYILWLAWRIATAPPLGEPTAATRAPSLRGGLLLGIANPKGWVAIAAVFASGHLAGGAAADAVAKVAVLAVAVVVIATTWLLAGASLAPLLRDPRRARGVNLIQAAALVAATSLAVLR